MWAKGAGQAARAGRGRSRSRRRCKAKAREGQGGGRTQAKAVRSPMPGREEAACTHVGLALRVQGWPREVEVMQHQGLWDAPGLVWVCVFACVWWWWGGNGPPLSSGIAMRGARGAREEGHPAPLHLSRRVPLPSPALLPTLPALLAVPPCLQASFPRFAAPPRPTYIQPHTQAVTRTRQHTPARTRICACTRTRAPASPIIAHRLLQHAEEIVVPLHDVRARAASLCCVPHVAAMHPGGGGTAGQGRGAGGLGEEDRSADASLCV